MVDIKLLSKDIDYKIFNEELDINHRRIYISEFPWKMIVDNARKMSSYDCENFELTQLINMYTNNIDGWVNEYEGRTMSYVWGEYCKYKDIIPPMKFDINKDDLRDGIYKYYSGLGWGTSTEWIISASKRDCDYFLKYDRLPEILYQCHNYTEGTYKIVAKYLLTVNKYDGNRYLLYEEDTDIKDIIKLKTEDKLKLLGIEL